MSLEGRIENGQVVFDEPVLLPEGTAVRVEAVTERAKPPAGKSSLLECLGDVVGAIDDLPADLAQNHDHYLYGTPKQ